MTASAHQPPAEPSVPPATQRAARRANGAKGPAAGIDPNRIARRIRRYTLPFLALMVLYLWWNYGLLTVPGGLDTMPATPPPGSTCLIDKGSATAKVGSVVFVRTDRGITMSRVVAIEEGEDGPRFLLANDNAESRIPDGSELGAQPPSAIEGVVLVVFPPDDARDLPDVGGAPRNR